MSEEEKKELEKSGIESNASGSESRKEYRFLDQKIKKRPVSRKNLILHIIGIVVSGAAVGLIAALVFSLIHPEVISGIYTERDAKITIPADEEPESSSLSVGETEQAVSDNAQEAHAGSAAAELTEEKEQLQDDDKTSEQPIEERPDEQISEEAQTEPEESSSEEELSGLEEQPTEETSKEPGEHSEEEAEAQAVSGEQSEEETLEETREQSAEEAQAEPGEQSAEEAQAEPGEQPAEGAPEETGEQSAEEAQAEPGEQSAEEAEAQAGSGEQSAEEAPAEPEEQSAEAASEVQENADVSEEPAEQEEPVVQEGAAEEADTAEEAISDTPEGINAEKDPAEEGESGSEAVEEIPEEKPVITLDEYRQLYKDMLVVADTAEHAVVQVIGITNEMDYFNQNYESQRRISGLVVAMNNTDLFVLTEYRVIEKAERIQVVFYDGAMTDASFQRYDPNTGLAIIKVQLASIGSETREDLVPAPLGNSYHVLRGEPILALGSPIGYSDSIAYGVITSTSRKASAVDIEYNLLMTDIDGSSDGSGVLVNLDGAVVGIITNAFATDNSNNSVTAIAISQLKELIQDLSNNEPQKYVGIKGQDVTQDIADRTGIPRGVLVTEVEPDSPAMLAGIKEFDVLVRIGEEQPIGTMRDYHRQLDVLEPEDIVSVTAMRKGAEGYSEITFEVTVEGR